MKVPYCLLFIFFSTTSWAQPETALMRGKVLDENKFPIPGALIYLKAIASDQVYAHTVAEENGMFTLRWESTNEPLSIEIRMLGFERLSVPIDSIDLREPNVFLLKENPQILQEIVISEDPFSNQNNDTTNYKLDKARQGDERNLEDLLKKLPNFSVSENGSISYKGTEISKIFVDGEDLSSDSYKRISRSLKSTVVKDIDVIERFVENTLLANSVQSSDVALNINIDTEGEVITGAATLQHGISKQRDLAVNVFKLNKGLKSFGVIQHNNVGHQTESFSAQFSGDLIAQFTENDKIGSYSPFLNLSINPALPLSTQVNLNNETTTSITMVVPLSDNSKWLSQIRYYDNNLREVIDSELINFLDLEGEESFRSSEFSNRVEEIDGYFLTNKLNIGLGENTQIVIDNRLSSTNRLFHNRLTFDINGESSTAAEEIFGMGSEFMLQNLSVTKRFPNESALQLNASYSRSDISQSLDVRSNDFLVINNVTYDSANQEISNNQTETAVELLWFLKGRKSFYRFFSGARIIRSDHLTELANDETDSVLSLNDLNSNRGLIYGGANFFRNWGVWDVDFTAKINQFKGDVNRNSLINMLLALYPSTETEVSYNIARNARLRLSHVYNRSFYEDQEIISSLILTDFRNLDRGAEQLLSNRYHRTSLSFYQENRSKYIEILMALNYRYNETDYVYNQQIDEGIIENFVEVGPSTKTLGGHLSLAKFFPALSSRVELTTKLQRQIAFVNVNSTEPSRLLLNNKQYQLKIGTSFDFPINIYGGFSTVNQQVLNEHEQKLSSLLLEMANLDFVFRNKNLIISQKNQIFWIENESLTVSKFDGSYKPNKGLFTFIFGLDNLFNIRSFSIPRATQFYSGSTNHQLLGRVFLLGLSFNF